MTYRGHVEKGVIVLNPPAQLPEGAEVEVRTAEAASSEPSFNLPKDKRPIWERLASLAASLPEEVIADLPRDGASQLDHYLYRMPKRTS